MRLAYLTCDFGVHLFGPKGASVHVRETTNALRLLGHDVRIFAPSVLAPDHDDATDVRHIPLDGFAAEAVELLSHEDAQLPEHLAREWRAVPYAGHAQRVLAPQLADHRPRAIYERYPPFAHARVGRS